MPKRFTRSDLVLAGVVVLFAAVLFLGVRRLNAVLDTAQERIEDQAKEHCAAVRSHLHSSEDSLIVLQGINAGCLK